MLIERKIQDVTVRTECAERFARPAGNVLDVFEEHAAKGNRLVAGTRIRFGWSMVNLVDEGDALRVTEPDFAAWPEPKWCPNIDTTLLVLAEQTALLHRLDAEGQDANFDQRIIVA